MNWLRLEVDELGTWKLGDLGTCGFGCLLSGRGLGGIDRWEMGLNGAGWLGEGGLVAGDLGEDFVVWMGRLDGHLNGDGWLGEGGWVAGDFGKDFVV